MRQGHKSVADIRKIWCINLNAVELLGSSPAACLSFEMIARVILIQVNPLMLNSFIKSGINKSNFQAISTFEVLKVLISFRINRSSDLLSQNGFSYITLNASRSPPPLDHLIPIQTKRSQQFSHDRKCEEDSSFSV